MKNRKTSIYSVILILMVSILVPLCVFSQDWAKTNIKNLQRVDLRDLGYPKVNEIPENSSAITSLYASRSGLIYGGTSGEEAYLFLFDPRINKVRHLGGLPDQEAIHHAIIEDGNGNIYFGTGRDMFHEIVLSQGGTFESISKTIWGDIKTYFQNYDGGHLYRYSPLVSNIQVKLADMKCDVEDLGIPLAHNSIYALTVSPKGDVIYGITYPDGHFFTYEIADKKFVDIGEVDQSIVFHGPERYWRSLSRSLICDGSGNVFFSGTDAIIKYYSPQMKTILSTNLKIPGEYYYAQFYEDYPVVDCFTKDNSGLIYGGTSDGYLFSFDPVEMSLINLGKPRAERRLRCLTVGKDGKVFLMAGERSSSRPCSLYSYNTKSGGFEDLGLLIVDRSPYYYWRGYQFDSMVTGADGTIYLGESERRSHLFIYMP